MTTRNPAAPHPPDDSDLEPASHLFTGVEYVPISAAELAGKTARIKRNLNRAYSELLEILDRQQWRADSQYTSFHDYCMKNFEISGSTGYRKAAAQRVNNILSEHKLPVVSERQARIVSDLPPATIVEVVQAAPRIADERYRSGLEAKFRKPGTFNSRDLERTRKELVPESPAPRDIEPMAPIPRKTYTARAPSEPITPYASNNDLSTFGRVYRFIVNGNHYHMHISAADFACFFEGEKITVGTLVDPFAE